jgi:hypothetical protein
MGKKQSSEIFLYLLGAGASQNSLPLASEFEERMLIFAKELKSNGQQEKGLMVTYDPKWGKPKLEFIKAVEWLAQETKLHNNSIDTFAKKLYLKKDREHLKKLKAVLSAYLIAEQQKKNVDPRYNSFFAHICKSDVYLPSNLRILTWNYDAQLEKAFYGFCDSEELVLKNITYNPQIRRINGCCGRAGLAKLDRCISEEVAL